VRALRAAWAAVRAVIGFSDVTAAVLLPYCVFAAALTVGVLAPDPSLSLAFACAGAGVAGLVLAFAFAIRRETGRPMVLIAPWMSVAVLGGVGATFAAALYSSHYTWMGWVALAGLALAALGVVVDLVVCVARAFGAGREHVELRPGLLLLKLVMIGTCAWLVVQTAGRIGARHLPPLLLMGFLIAAFAAVVTAAVASPLFATHAAHEGAPATDSLPSPDGGDTIARTRGGRGGRRTQRRPVRRRTLPAADDDEGV
jgi:hypothetical protein